MEFTKARIAEQLATARYGRSLTLVDETGSTNDDARRAALSGAVDGHVIVANSQSQGRGSRGRTWVSPPGLDLYLSVIARVPLSIAELPPLTLAVGIAVAATVEGFLPEGLKASVKWPNDVWVERRKCAGILVESASMGSETPQVVIGIGLNVNRRDFPAGLDTAPTSLTLEAKLVEDRPLDRALVLAALLGHLERWVDRYVTYGPTPIVQALTARLALRQELASCDGIEGYVEGVSPEGALLLRTPQGLKSVVSGTLRPVV